MSIFKNKPAAQTAVSTETVTPARRNHRKGMFSAGIVALAVAAVICWWPRFPRQNPRLT